ncbi:hypothetical protein [Roseibium litorale]|uniref:Uncharacterized protein n=1 Tax=Roseibium litorale TaxID=2803841 RepID=A0ABR9CHY0_9HYPH|nr:hypothetical protein [Roseibium litorale]MBD8890438.1 hypothetical protein [Roseibium litorale]
MQAIFRPISILACALLLAACERNDPRYPVFYSYRVDVKVDGVPVTIERVIKCTGTLVTDWMVSPGTTTGGDYANPPVIGAKVPGTKSAVYTPVIHACRWASASPSEIEEDKKKVHRFLAQPFTEEHSKLKPDSKMPVLWVNDAETFDRMEYYVSETGLSGKQGHVEFIKVYPPVKVDRRAFRASEKRAGTESPDLTPFIFPRDNDYAYGTTLYKERGMRPGIRIVSVCYGAWRFPKSEWSKVPGLEEWVATLPKNGRAYLISDELWPNFTQTFQHEGWRSDPSLVPVGYMPKGEGEKVGRFATYDTIHPVFSTDEGSYVDLNESGSFGCIYEPMYPNRWQINVDRSTKPTASYPMKLEANRLWADFRPADNPVYVAELDEFIVFTSLSAGPNVLDEPVVKGWKE